jgi:hypothetical protein
MDQVWCTLRWPFYRTFYFASSEQKINPLGWCLIVDSKVKLSLQHYASRFMMLWVKRREVKGSLFHAASDGRESIKFVLRGGLFTKHFSVPAQNKKINPLGWCLIVDSKVKLSFLKHYMLVVDTMVMLWGKRREVKG